MDYNKIIKDISKKIFSPLYLFFGEEEYFIQQLVSSLENHVLMEQEKSFNYSLLYGNEIELPQFLSLIRRYPVLSGRQLIILKEAQLLKSLEKSPDFEAYCDHPVPTTVLAIVFRGNVDKRKKIFKKLLSASVVFESRPPHSGRIPDIIEDMAKYRNLSFTQRASLLMIEHVGQDLARIDIEMDKLLINCGAGAIITEKEIEEFVGISREFNYFELQRALGAKDLHRSQFILDHLLRNKKEYPPMVIIASMFTYFQKVWLLHSLSSASREEISKKTGIWSTYLDDYLLAKKNFSGKKVIESMSHLFEADLRLKGIENSSLDENGIMHVLIHQILQ